MHKTASILITTITLLPTVDNNSENLTIGKQVYIHFSFQPFLCNYWQENGIWFCSSPKELANDNQSLWWWLAINKKKTYPFQPFLTVLTVKDTSLNLIKPSIQIQKITGYLRSLLHDQPRLDSIQPCYLPLITQHY